MRFRSLEELKKHLSPDVEVIERDEPTEAKKQVAKAHSQRSVLEDRFAFHWDVLGGPALVREYRFHPTRRWRFDFALPPVKVAFEIMGGLYQAESGHRSREGVKRDYEKTNAAQELGWKVFSLTSENVNDVEYLEQLIQRMKGDHDGLTKVE